MYIHVYICMYVCVCVCYTKWLHKGYIDMRSPVHRCAHIHVLAHMCVSRDLTQYWQRCTCREMHSRPDDASQSNCAQVSEIREKERDREGKRKIIVRDIFDECKK